MEVQNMLWYRSSMMNAMLYYNSIESNYQSTDHAPVRRLEKDSLRLVKAAR